MPLLNVNTDIINTSC